MEEDNPTIVLILIILLIIVSFIVFYKNDTIREYKDYYNKTESLLDSIASQHEDFLDTTAEQDVYIEYLEARNKIE